MGQESNIRIFENQEIEYQDIRKRSFVATDQF